MTGRLIGEFSESRVRFSSALAIDSATTKRPEQLISYDFERCRRGLVTRVTKVFRHIHIVDVFSSEPEILFEKIFSGRPVPTITFTTEFDLENRTSELRVYRSVITNPKRLDLLDADFQRLKDGSELRSWAEYDPSFPSFLSKNHTCYRFGEKLQAAITVNTSVLLRQLSQQNKYQLGEYEIIWGRIPIIACSFTSPVHKKLDYVNLQVLYSLTLNGEVSCQFPNIGIMAQYSSCSANRAPIKEPRKCKGLNYKQAQENGEYALEALQDSSKFASKGWVSHEFRFIQNGENVSGQLVLMTSIGQKIRTPITTVPKKDVAILAEFLAQEFWTMHQKDPLLQKRKWRESLLLDAADLYCARQL